MEQDNAPGGGAVEDLEHIPFVLLAWLRVEQPDDDQYTLFPPDVSKAMSDLWALYTEPFCDTATAVPRYL